MTLKEHKAYIAALKQYSDTLLKSEKDVKGFFVDAGIHTQTGRLTKVYSSSEPIGYRREIIKEAKNK